MDRPDPRLNPDAFMGWLLETHPEEEERLAVVAEKVVADVVTSMQREFQAGSLRHEKAVKDVVSRVVERALGESATKEELDEAYSVLALRVNAAIVRTIMHELGGMPVLISHHDPDTTAN
jgi:hypothetical protein